MSSHCMAMVIKRTLVINETMVCLKKIFACFSKLKLNTIRKMVHFTTSTIPHLYLTLPTDVDVVVKQIIAFSWPLCPPL